MAGTPLRLWGNGHQAITVEIVAAFAGVELEIVPHFTLGATNKTPKFLEMSPSGKIPVLQLSGKASDAISDSSEIYRYIAGKSAGALYPAAADVRTPIDGWVAWAGLNLEPLLHTVAHPLIKGRNQEKSTESISSGESKLHKALAHLDGAISASPCLVGARITLADVVVGSALTQFYITMFDPATQARYPHLSAYLKSLYDHEAWARLLGAPLVAPTTAHSLESPLVAAGGHGIAERLYPQFWSGNRVRQAFLEFYASKDHTVVESSSVVPHQDPTLLFANAGMNQFKPIFLGTADPNSALAKLKRATDTQKCIRAGGKHNDLDDVGKDVYHHTFFEMLGNWSFGDYFKEEAIAWAWELLTVVYKLDPSRLYATYFEGDPSQGLAVDSDAQQIWRKYLPEARILPFGCGDNFWEMGDQGPCGPCTEIHYDRIGGRDAAHLVNLDDPNVLEIWNLVFIQFNREEDRSLISLPNKHVDTGMGMERVTSVLQNVVSNYATDIFGPIFDKIRAVSNAPPYEDRVGDDDADGKDMAYRVVADHIRTLSFAIADGAAPGSDGRDYVLRRVLRRAVRYGRQTLNAPEGFFAKLVDVVVENFGGFYPELRKKRDHIYNTITAEEVSFSRTLVKGIEKYKKAAAAAKAEGSKVLPGAVAFDLWETSGFPLDLTVLMAEEDHLTVDEPGYEASLEAAREKSRAVSKKGGASGIKFEAEATGHLQKTHVPVTDDSSKYGQENTATTLLAILSDKGFVQSTQGLGDSLVGLVLSATSFYAESGGQVADTGAVEAAGGSFTVDDTRVAAGYVLHVGRASVTLTVGESVTSKVDYGRRGRIVPNHTFTHVLNLALRNVLGGNIDQKGSIVQPERLRFDFSHNGVIDTIALEKIEAECKACIAESLQVFSKEVPLADAKAINGLRAVFGEVYPDPVRVVSVGRPVEELLADPSNASNSNYSIEFCGGTHLSNTSVARAFALMSEEGIAKGIRRIVAVTAAEAEAAIAEAAQLQVQLEAAKQLHGAEKEKAVAALKQVVEGASIPAVAKAALRTGLAEQQAEITKQSKAAAAAVKAKATEMAVGEANAAAASNLKSVVIRMDVGLDTKALTEAWAACQVAQKDLAIMFVTSDAGKGKVLAWAGVPPASTGKLPAGDWVKAALELLGGKGGGKPGQAQGQGPNIEKISEAVQAASAFAALKLQ